MNFLNHRFADLYVGAWYVYSARFVIVYAVLWGISTYVHGS